MFRLVIWTTKIDPFLEIKQNCKALLFRDHSSGVDTSKCCTILKLYKYLLVFFHQKYLYIILHKYYKTSSL